MGSYRVKKGDSLYAIAKANNTTVANLYKLNPSLAARKAAGKNVIFSNSLVKVPGAGKPAQSSSRTSSPSRGSSTPKTTITRKTTDTGTGRGRSESSSTRTTRSSATRTSSKPTRLAAATYNDVMNLAARTGLSRSEIAALNVARVTKKAATPKARKKTLLDQQVSDLMSAINNPVTR